MMCSSLTRSPLLLPAFSPRLDSTLYRGVPAERLDLHRSLASAHSSSKEEAQDSGSAWLAARSGRRRHRADGAVPWRGIHLSSLLFRSARGSGSQSVFLIGAERLRRRRNAREM